VKSPSNEGGYTIEEILCQDPWHTQNIILHPRDKNGNLILSEKARPETACASVEEYARKSLEQLDLPAWMVRKLVAEALGTIAGKQQKAMTQCSVTGVT
jgi:hypothetical protein